MRYNDTHGVNPRLRANDTELSYDTDNDGLTLKEEGKANADPTLKDTDGDGLNDSYEVSTLLLLVREFVIFLGHPTPLHRAHQKGSNMKNQN